MFLLESLVLHYASSRTKFRLNSLDHSTGADRRLNQLTLSTANLTSTANEIITASLPPAAMSFLRLRWLALRTPSTWEMGPKDTGKSLSLYASSSASSKRVDDLARGGKAGQGQELGRFRAMRRDIVREV